MYRRSLALIVFCGIAFGNVWAMECARKPLSTAVEEADVIFMGTVKGRYPIDEPSQYCWRKAEEKPDCGSKVATLEVQQVWKGDVGSNASVYSEDACYCRGVYFPIGEQYIVFAIDATKRRQFNPRYEIESACAGTTMISEYTIDFPKEMDRFFESQYPNDN